jgi:outer membrane autotransporter protein
MIVNGAIVSPGSSPGTLTINGNYTQTAAGVLQMELGGLTPGSGFDRLVVNGHATLAGTLNVTLVNGFTPSVGDTFSLLSYTSRSGSFSTINLPALPKPLALTAEYTPAALTLLTGSTLDTKPTNTLSVIATGSGSWELLISGEPGRTYRLQASTNLIDWLDLSTITPSNGLFRFVDPDATKLNRRFYRTVSP